MPIEEKSPGHYQFRVATGRDPVTGKYGRKVRHVVGPAQTGKQAPKVIRDQYAAFVSEVRDGGAATPRRGATLNDAWARFLEVAQIEPLTRQDYESKWKLHIAPGIGKTPMVDLTPMDCTQLYARLTAAGKSPATVRRLHALIRNACRTACNELGWVKTNPALNARLPRAGTQVGLEPPSPEAVRKLIELAHETDPEFEVFLELAAGMGGRRGEVIALRRSDLEEHDNGTMTLHVRHAAYQLAGQSQVHLKAPKSHQARKVRLGPDLAAMIRAHLARQTMRAHTARCELAEDPFLFSADPAGLQPWSPDPVSKRFKRLWARTGAPHARLHDLRHFHATDLVEAGVPITVIQKRLGHSNVSVTSRYAHSREEADEAAAEAYEARRRAR